MKKIFVSFLILFSASSALAYLSPGYVNFGNISCDSRATQTVTFYNNTDENVQNLRASVSGSSFFESSFCYNVRPYGSCSIQVTFDPRGQPGSDYGTLWVYADIRSYTASLNGSCR